MNESCLIPKGTATHDNLCFYSDTGMYNSGNDGGTHDIFPMMIISTLLESSDGQCHIFKQAAPCEGVLEYPQF